MLVREICQRFRCLFFHFVSFLLFATRTRAPDSLVPGLQTARSTPRRLQAELWPARACLPLRQGRGGSVNSNRERERVSAYSSLLRYRLQESIVFPWARETRKTSKEREFSREKRRPYERNSRLEVLTQNGRISKPKTSSPRGIRTKTHWLTLQAAAPRDNRKEQVRVDRWHWRGDCL